jgi:hypothetical protein
MAKREKFARNTIEAGFEGTTNNFALELFKFGALKYQ